MVAVATIEVDPPSTGGTLRVFPPLRRLLPVRVYRRTALISLLALVALLLVACGGDDSDIADGASPTPTAAADGDVVADASDDEDRAEEVTPEEIQQLYGLNPGLQLGRQIPHFDGLTGWLNSPELTSEQLVADGRVVLVDFWTYTCVNCLRTLPFIKDWHEKYAEHGLVVLGVHAPEFEFEEEPANVLNAVSRQGIEYPVAQDNEMHTWRAFFNNVWPAKYLFSSDGELVYRHFGEGAYAEAELEIRSALEAAGADLSGIEVGGVEEPQFDPDVIGITRELYGGYQRNLSNEGIYAGQEEYYRGIDRVAEYVDDQPHGHQQWYLQGEWRNERESIQHARRTENLEDWLAFRFLARSVNVVMHPGDGEAGAYDVVVELDGRPLVEEEAGADIHFDAQGRSIITVDEPRMYAVIELPELGDRELKLLSDSEHFGMFAVTFGAYLEGA
jgi:thiol-disulfide isomerase/thioredoxin